VIEVVSLEALLKHISQVLVIGFLLKFQLAAILHVFLELGWVSAAEFVKRSLELLLFDVVVLLILVSTW
jgi:hypothetical protein